MINLFAENQYHNDIGGANIEEGLGVIMRVLGFMSGTSLDGVDAAILNTDGETVEELGPTHLVSFSSTEQAILTEVTEQFVASGSPDTKLLDEADNIIVNAHIRCANELLSMPGAGAIELIGYHGQTVLHRPDQGITIQIGDPAKLAAALRVDVVADLRQADITSGGQGAPLVPVYHAALANKIRKVGPIAFLNIGGVANFTYIGLDGEIIALDTGPGNGMLDLTVQRRGLGRYDEGGIIAASGRVDFSVLQQLLDHPYFRRTGPKSLDRYDFSLDAVASLSDADAAATLVAFTAHSVALAASALPSTPNLWIVCGGGRKNPAIMAALAETLGNCENSDDFGLRGDFIEAEAIGFIAVRSIKGLPVTFPKTTGTPRPVTAGQLYTTT